MMLVDNKFEMGERVYLVTDVDQFERIVTSIQITAGGILAYQLACGPDNSWHFEFEISKEKNLMLNAKREE